MAHPARKSKRRSPKTTSRTTRSPASSRLGRKRPKRRSPRLHYKLKLPPTKRQGTIDDRRMQIALKGIKQGREVSEIAPEIGVSTRHLSRRLALSPYAVKKRGKWHVRKVWPRQVWIYSDRRLVQIVVPDFETASKVGTYLNANGKIAETNDPAHLAPFIGASVTDVEGKDYVFETDPNTLYRLISTVGPYEQVYRLIT